MIRCGHQWNRVVTDGFRMPPQDDAALGLHIFEVVDAGEVAVGKRLCFTGGLDGS